jgi:hypothetical protein
VKEAVGSDCGKGAGHVEAHLVTPHNQLKKFYITTPHIKLKKPYDATPHIRLWQLSPTLHHTYLFTPLKTQL